jgi:Tetratricopeptide repeat
VRTNADAALTDRPRLAPIWRSPQAERPLRRALAIYEKALGPSHPDTVCIGNNFGVSPAEIKALVARNAILLSAQSVLKPSGVH